VENIKKFLNADQIKKLKQLPDHKGHNLVWSSENPALPCNLLSCRELVGRNGYDYLRKMNYPLPSYRTLCRQIQNSTFTPGIQHDVLQWLRLKMSNAQESQKLCVLLIDEMQLKSRIEFDRGLRHIVGYFRLTHYRLMLHLELTKSLLHMLSCLCREDSLPAGSRPLHICFLELR